MLTTDSMSWDEVMHAPSPQPHAMDHELLKQAQSRSSRLNFWEAQFLRSISGRFHGGRALSEKQRAKLQERRGNEESIEPWPTGTAYAMRLTAF